MGPNPTELISLKEEEVTAELCVYLEKGMSGYSEKTAICE